MANAELPLCALARYTHGVFNRLEFEAAGMSFGEAELL